LPMPVVRTSSMPCPSTAMTVSTWPCQVSSKARMPHRFPSPSSPTLAAKMTRPGSMGCRERMTAAPLNMAATATQLSPITGPYRRWLVQRICKGVARGKTVSRCAATSVVGPRLPALKSPVTLEMRSIWTSLRPIARIRSATYAARSASSNVGAGIRHKCMVSSSTCSRLSVNLVRLSCTADEGICMGAFSPSTRQTRGTGQRGMLAHGACVHHTTSLCQRQLAQVADLWQQYKTHDGYGQGDKQGEVDQKSVDITHVGIALGPLLQAPARIAPCHKEEESQR